MKKKQSLVGTYKPKRIYPSERTPEELRLRFQKTYTIKDESISNYVEHTNRVVYPMYVNPKNNVMELDFQGQPWSKSPIDFPNEYYINREIRNPSKDYIADNGVNVKGYDKERLLYTDKDDALNAFIYPIDNLVTLESNQMKFAGQTYDNNGNLIPLSERFDWNNPDIRYLKVKNLHGELQELPPRRLRGGITNSNGNIV